MEYRIVSEERWLTQNQENANFSKKIDWFVEERDLYEPGDSHLDYWSQVNHPGYDSEEEAKFALEVLISYRVSEKLGILPKSGGYVAAPSNDTTGRILAFALGLSL